MLGFDGATGLLTVEAGVLLGDIVATLLPRGWFPAVVPGTRFVTVGGAIAADVHGKNHRTDGGFGEHVAWLDLVDADGTVRRCSAGEDAELFRATVGGMGLTGVILRAAIRLRPVESAWLRQRTLAVPDPATALATIEEAGDWRYAIAWIDCLAAGRDRFRALVTLGEHAAASELDPARARRPLDLAPPRRPRVPLTPPLRLVPRAGVRAMNALRYRAGARAPRDRLVGWEEFFFPLDAVGRWSRLYGRPGLLQHQSVLPLARAEAGLAALLEAGAAAGLPAWLATLKRLGPGRGALSFPMEGYSLALDYPATPAALALLDRLDRIVLDHGGRFYLAKDARLPARTFAAAEPRAAAFRAFRERTGAAGRFVSAQSERLGL